jgi:peptide/nickel transport system substrate-binding protein
MNQSKKRTLLILLFFVLLLSGCADAVGFLLPEKESEPERVTTYDITIPTEKVRTLNPVVSKDEDTYYLSRLLYEGLFSLDESLAAEPLLVESYFYSDDGMTLTMKLKDGIVWQDGTKLSANDVKLSIEAYQTAAASGLTLYSSHVEGIRSVKVADEMSVVVTFKDQNNAAIENFIFPILPSHLYRRATDLVKDIAGFVPVGTGPYRYEIGESGDRFKLTGNSNFSGTIPANVLNVKVIPGKEEAVNLFTTGEINMTLLKTVNRETLLGTMKVNVVTFPSNEAEVLGFNSRSEAVQDPLVRQAVATAINNEALIESCYYNNGVLNDSLYYPGYLGIESQKDAYPFDPDAAKQLLTRAGAGGISLAIIVNQEEPSRVLAGQLIKTDLERVGIKVNLSELSWADYLDALEKGNYDIYLGGFQFRDTYDLRPYLHADYTTVTGYKNASLDVLLDKMQSGVDKETKASLYRSARVILNTELPYYTLLYKTYGIAVPTTFEGALEPRFFDIYNGCESWSIVNIS